MESGSGFKSMAFITLSGICHGICVAAIGLAPSAHLPSGGNTAVEVAVNDSAPAEMAAAGAPQAEAAKVTEASTTEAPAAAVTPAAPAVQKSIAPIAKKSIAKKSVTKKIVMVEPAATDEEIQKEIAAETGTPIEAVAEETAPAESETKKDVVATEAPKSEETVAVAPAAATTPEETANTNQEAATDAAAPATDAAAAPAAAVGAATAADAATATNNSGETAGTENAGAGAGNATEPTTAGQIEGTRSFQSLTQKAGNRAPEYPIEARAQNRQGNVELIYFVNKEGLVEQAKVATSSGHADLDQAALNTISNYRFVPGQEGWTRHAVNFSLKGETASQPARLRTMGAQGR